ncbi:dynamin-related protein Dnm1p [Monosporozyma unispora]|nr:Dynamin- GTPase protein [Kazachstania unispora]
MASLEDLIPTVNKLQDVMYSSGIDSLDLPILAVVGSQSSGKSSILETLVGRDFLPRGTGIVTRRPLVLQLNNIPSLYNSTTPDSFTAENSNKNGTHKNIGDDLTELSESDIATIHTRESTNSHEEWGEFLHKPGQKFYDFNEIRREIEFETARIAGKNKGISKVPINLKIFSPHVLNLTLVDLPGITKVPIGEQPHDIEKQIKNLILDYVATPNCLILAVTPANVDLVNSESLKLAKEVDPQGKRTIGVVTKLDLMDSGTHALDILLGKVYPLKLGFVGIVNRSQQDIQLNVTVKEALDNEDHYFKRHPIYRTISDKCGTRYLAKLLNKTLMSHIRDKLPDIKTKLNNLITQTEKELNSYGGTALINSKANKAGIILQLINIFAKNFTSSIDGNSMDINTKELCGGARIYYIYNNIFGKSLETLNPTSNLTALDIKTAIRNSTGPRATLFVPELAFDLLVKPQIKLLLDPSRHCVELVFEELMKICHGSSNTELARYPNLKNTLTDVVSELLRERLNPTFNYVDSLIEIHRAYINTNHPRFLSATEVMTDILKQREMKKNRVTSGMAQKKTASLQNNITENGKKADNNSTLSFKNNSTSNVDLTNDPFNDVNANDNNLERDDARSNYGSTISNNTNNPDKETFLKYFFGKEKDNLMANNIDQNKSRPEAKASDQTGIQDGSIFSTLNLNDNDTIQNHITEDYITDEEASQLTEREQLECELIRRLIVSYFDIVREMIQDQVPKAIMCLLVNHCKETIHNRLVTELYKDSIMDELLQEDETLAQERANCELLLQTYKKASVLVNNIL